jgi:hypothetical protein
MVSLTNANVTSATVVNEGGSVLIVIPSVDPATPSLDDGMALRPGFGIDSSKTLAEWFPGKAGANRLHVYSHNVRGRAFGSHA